MEKPAEKCVRATKMGCRAVCASCRVELFDVDDTYYACNGEYLV